MKSPASKQTIDLFLKKFFKDWQSRCFVAPRDKNNHALIDLGLTAFQRKEIILDLKPNHYQSGPEKELNSTQHGKGQIWIFGVVSNGVDIYVKLKTTKKNGWVLAICLSFHRAQWPMVLPYKEGK